MLVFLVPAEVRRNVTLPPGVITAGENGPEPREPKPDSGVIPHVARIGDPFRGARIASVPEAQLEDFGSGLTPVTEGWFVVNVRDAEWWNSAMRGARCAFDNEYGDPPVEFAQLGINLTVLEPGETGLYHAEENQEAFLVLSGECALLVEGEERRLRPWDFFHSPPWTEHAFVGASEEPCVILMVGARSGPGVHYPVSELAARYGASVAEETSDWRQAYAGVELFRRERPPNWARLPWA
jgi:uncharacterized cupin superfamily protein